MAVCDGESDPCRTDRRVYGNEKRFVEALLEHDEGTPSWFQGARLSTKEEDHRMIDVVVYTDIGPFFVQVKSSKKGERKFYARLQKTIARREERLRYVCIVVDRGKRASLLSIRKRAFEQIRGKRRKLRKLLGFCDKQIPETNSP